MLQLKKSDNQSSALSRVMAHVAGDGSCLIWRGTLNLSGYGYMKFEGKNWRVHRLVFEQIHGLIPEGLVLDHLCRNRACCNPNHLEIVTVRENLMRGESIQALNARKTHCKAGHLLSGENLSEKNSGYRGCKICNRAYSRKYREMKHAQ